MSKGQGASLYLRGALASAAIALVFGAGVYVARASAAAAAPAALSYAGQLLKNDAPMTGPQKLTFSFKKASQVICSSSPLDVTPDASGRFQVLIPMATCPSSLFDGTAVTVDITVGSDLAAKDTAVTPVPYAIHAEQLGTADCPSGYDREELASAAASVIGCVRGNDHVVRVGVGATAFWIDRYEASVWSDFAAKGTQYGDGATPFPAGFPASGQITLDNQLYAVSKFGILPTSQLTWFQASRACRASGKRLPSNEEWTEAATGTPRGAEAQLSPCTSAQGLHPTGQGGACVSVWGAEDMVGNVTEIISEWAIGVGTEAQFTPYATWPPGFGGAMWNVTSTTFEGSVGPMGVQRGATSNDKSAASVFSVAATQTVAQPMLGFRCMIPR